MTTDIKYNINEDANKLAISDLKYKLEKIYLGGGEKKLQKQRRLKLRPVNHLQGPK